MVLYAIVSSAAATQKATQDDERNESAREATHLTYVGTLRHGLGRVLFDRRLSYSFINVRHGEMPES